MATEIIDTAADADRGDRSARLRARAAAAGSLTLLPSKRVSRAERERIIASTRGQGPIADRLIGEERDRL